MMGNHVIATHLVLGSYYDVFGCFDGDTPENEFDFFDVFDMHGECLTLGNPFYEKPTRQDVVEVVKDYLEMHGEYQRISD